MPNYKRIRKAFSRDDLARVCAMHETSFGRAYQMETQHINRPHDNYYYFQDNGSDVLAVGHLDTVGPPHTRAAHFVTTEGGEVVYSRALDDRLGVYTILELLPALGIKHDVLLTVGEESGQSTAAFFDAPRNKDYRYIIEFDRGGTDVVLYEYEDDDTIAAVELAGARVGDGIFSDICELQHLGIKGFNWGIGYRDYHSPRAHAYLNDTFQMVARYVKFHDMWADEFFAHQPTRFAKRGGYWWDEEDDTLAMTSYNGIAGVDEQEIVADWRAREDEEPDIWDIDYIKDDPTREELEELEAAERNLLDRRRDGADALDRDWLEATREDLDDAPLQSISAAQLAHVALTRDAHADQRTTSARAHAARLSAFDR